jgi:hypothetical protein
MTVFTQLGYFRFGLFQRDFLLMQLFSLFFRVFIPVSALIADRIGREKCLLCHNGHRFFWFCLFFFLEFRQSSSGDFVLMYRNGFDGVYLWSFGNFLQVVSYEHSLLGTFYLIWLESSEQLCAYDCDLAGDSL